MFEHMIAVTNRKLVTGDFLEQIRRVCRKRPKAVVLREKDLSLEEYIRLAEQVRKVCEEEKVPLYLHGFEQAAKALGIRRLHLPLESLRMLKNPAEWEILGTSCHSVEQMEEAVALGATYLFLGNIFETDCKPGLPGKGLELLKEVCEKCPVPVYAIGGVTMERMEEILKAGAAGGCMMSGFMK
ncbi:thiamine phosphate synthase [Anaerotignum lactatifermentans]|uniref:Thiamine phosphate synthase n=1 Tax=Anaerotignum lactatifermentans TaxID=160404 RepID=A0ABS2GAD5_9FIRM|nr:thiamine phosphate synthase [Anaerotignum lactatifermentans]MBM6829286.1 thiamine phosphate synthase [Anaerotignum lactatifermentans]MBM6877474.1 thiamine phosphate synthase [Anaerotignum lactatifermentans]MBM6950864.1 thiamine phosphate synthase [Anaerotignum lactatifermentans]